MADTIMNHNMQIEVPSIIMNYHFDKYGNPVSFDRIQNYYINEYDQVISLEEEPSQSYQVRVLGQEKELREVKNEDEIDIDCFFVNYPQGLVKFHPSMSKKIVTIIYKGIGNTSISANRIFLAVDGNGCITDTLDSFYKRIKAQTDEIEKLGGACLVITNLSNNIDSGNNLYTLLQESIQLATPLEKSLGIKVSEGTTLLENLTTQNTEASSNIETLTTQNTTANTNITNLNEAIKQSADHVEAITGTNNPYVEITTAQWGEVNDNGEYTVKVNHGLKSKDIVYKAWVNGNESYNVNVKIESVNEVTVTSDINSPMKIVFNVRSYGGFNDPVANEKIENMKTQLNKKADSDKTYTKEEIEEKNLKIEESVKNISYINLIENSTGYNRSTNSWKYQDGVLNAIRRDGQISGYALRFFNNKTTSVSLLSNVFNVDTNNKTYTFSGWVYVPDDCNGVDIYITSTADNATNNGDVYSEKILSFSNKDGFKEFSTSFVIPDYSWDSANIEIIHKGSNKNGLNTNIDFGDLILTKTNKKVPYKPNPNEVLLKNVKITSEDFSVNTKEGSISIDNDNGLYREDKYGKHRYLGLIEEGTVNHLHFKNPDDPTDTTRTRIYLPDEFKGKHFTVFAAPIGWFFPYDIDMDIIRTSTSGVFNKDYDNATFDIYYKIGNGKTRQNVNIRYLVIA